MGDASIFHWKFCPWWGTIIVAIEVLITLNYFYVLFISIFYLFISIYHCITLISIVFFSLPRRSISTPMINRTRSKSRPLQVLRHSTWKASRRATSTPQGPPVIEDLSFCWLSSHQNATKSVCRTPPLFIILHTPKIVNVQYLSKFLTLPFGLTRPLIGGMLM